MHPFARHGCGSGVRRGRERPAGTGPSLGGVLTTGTGGSSNGPTPFAYALGGNSQVWQHTDLGSGSWSQVTP